MSAFGGKADITIGTCPLSRSPLGVKRTWVDSLHMSAFDPKRTCQPQRILWWQTKVFRFNRGGSVVAVDPRDGFNRRTGSARSHFCVPFLLSGSVGQVEMAPSSRRHSLHPRRSRQPQLLIPCESSCYIANFA